MKDGGGKSAAKRSEGVAELLERKRGLIRLEQASPELPIAKQAKKETIAGECGEDFRNSIFDLAVRPLPRVRRLGLETMCSRDDFTDLRPERFEGEVQADEFAARGGEASTKLGVTRQTNNVAGKRFGDIGDQCMNAILKLQSFRSDRRGDHRKPGTESLQLLRAYRCNKEN